LTSFYIAFIIVIVGLGVVFWLMYREKEDTVKPDLTPKEPGQDPSKILSRLGLQAEKPSLDLTQDEGNFFTKILTAIGLKKKEEEEIIPLSLPPLEKKAGQLNLNPGPGTFSNPLEHQHKEPAPTRHELNEFKEKYDRLEVILREKNQELEKTHQTLLNELKNQKEYNKVKDILEKEIKDLKDKSRALQIELSDNQTEIGKYKLRINQLEEKVAKGEKIILTHEDALREKDLKIASLQQNLQQKTKPVEIPTLEPKAVVPPPTEVIQEIVPPEPAPIPETSPEPLVEDLTPKEESTPEEPPLALPPDILATPPIPEPVKEESIPPPLLEPPTEEPDAPQQQQPSPEPPKEENSPPQEPSKGEGEAKNG